MSMSALPGRSRPYLVAVVLTGAYSLNFLDRQLLSILAEPIKKDLMLSDPQLALMSGLAFALFYTVLGIPLAWLSDRTNRVRIIASACALWSLFTGACGFAQTFGQMALARVGVAVGEAGGSPPSYSTLADYFPPPIAAAVPWRCIRWACRSGRPQAHSITAPQGLASGLLRQLWPALSRIGSIWRRNHPMAVAAAKHFWHNGRHWNTCSHCCAAEAAQRYPMNCNVPLRRPNPVIDHTVGRIRR